MNSDRKALVLAVFVIFLMVLFAGFVIYKERQYTREITNLKIEMGSYLFEHDEDCKELMLKKWLGMPKTKIDYLKIENSYHIYTLDFPEEKDKMALETYEAHKENYC